MHLLRKQDFIVRCLLRDLSALVTAMRIYTQSKYSLRYQGIQFICVLYLNILKSTKPKISKQQVNKITT